MADEKKVVVFSADNDALAEQIRQYLQEYPKKEENIRPLHPGGDESQTSFAVGGERALHDVYEYTDRYTAIPACLITYGVWNEHWGVEPGKFIELKQPEDSDLVDDGGPEGVERMLDELLSESMPTATDAATPTGDGSGTTVEGESGEDDAHPDSVNDTDAGDNTTTGNDGDTISRKDADLASNDPMRINSREFVEELLPPDILDDMYMLGEDSVHLPDGMDDLTPEAREELTRSVRDTNESFSFTWSSIRNSLRIVTPEDLERSKNDIVDMMVAEAASQSSKVSTRYFSTLYELKNFREWIDQTVQGVRDNEERRKEEFMAEQTRIISQEYDATHPSEVASVREEAMRQADEAGFADAREREKTTRRDATANIVAMLRGSDNPVSHVFSSVLNQSMIERDAQESVTQRVASLRRAAEEERRRQEDVSRQQEEWLEQQRKMLSEEFERRLAELEAKNAGSGGPDTETFPAASAESGSTPASALNDGEDDEDVPGDSVVSDEVTELVPDDEYGEDEDDGDPDVAVSGEDYDYDHAEGVMEVEETDNDDTVIPETDSDNPDIEDADNLHIGDLDQLDDSGADGGQSAVEAEEKKRKRTSAMIAAGIVILVAIGGLWWAFGSNNEDAEEDAGADSGLSAPEKPDGPQQDLSGLYRLGDTVTVTLDGQLTEVQITEFFDNETGGALGVTKDGEEVGVRQAQLDEFAQRNPENFEGRQGGVDSHDEDDPALDDDPEGQE